ncbi:peptidoglycan-synthase activator LpoB [Fluviicoccus keumensis]|uniref:Peptidoglycan-synthase activator LpoB n=1 Tax=Fluviicoccus keumensis TaxID=1435465 RepID=A0A4Q7ZBU3_9GAMM|nr:penicillin-binding protein activator LpoB [Fluviicoccus keumensis]RZU47634.1 peptidoglycan-synthase activator LpoB [Fluviicoccus keumensis]
MKTAKLLAITWLAAGLTGCATVSTTRSPGVDLQAAWALAPAVNNTETPQAGARLDSLTASLLRVHGVRNLSVYPAARSGDALFDQADRAAQEKAMAWAREQQARYVVAGSVDEWRYKVGLDGEPAAGITLSVTDLSTGQVIWSGSAARTGWSREAVSGVAQKVVNELLDQALVPAR